MASRRLIAAAFAGLRSPRPLFLSISTHLRRSIYLHSLTRSQISKSYNPILQFTINHRWFSSRSINSSYEHEERSSEALDETDLAEKDIVDGENMPGSKKSGKSPEEIVKGAEEIGYEVVGPFDPSVNPFKPYEPVFAVAQIGSHRFKVSNGDSIFTENLKYCDINDKLILNRVLKRGYKTQTIIGRPILPDAAVHTAVEELGKTRRETDRLGLAGAGSFKSMNFVQSILEENEQYSRKKKTDFVHVLLTQKKTFVTVTDARGNKKTGASAGCLEERKGRSRLSRYAAEATAEHVGRSARKMGLKSVVVKVKGSTFFRKKKKVILSWREGFRGEGFLIDELDAKYMKT